MKKYRKQITRENFSKKILSSLLAITIAFGFAGCNKREHKTETVKNSVLENTLLEETFVVNTDLGIMIVKTDRTGHLLCDHYKDVVSGLEFADKNTCNCDVHLLYSIEKIGVITNYLSEDEMIKASKNELTEEDIIAIVARIQTSEIDKQDKQIEKKLTK